LAQSHFITPNWHKLFFFFSFFLGEQMKNSIAQQNRNNTPGPGIEGPLTTSQVESQETN
jgi:hypothetical protein